MARLQGKATEVNQGLENVPCSKRLGAVHLLQRKLEADWMVKHIHWEKTLGVKAP